MRKLSAAIWLASCLSAGAATAGDVPRFYQANPNPPPWGTVAADGDVAMMPASGDIKHDLQEAQAEGKVTIGWSSFDGRSASPSEVRSFAKKIGASEVLYRTGFQGDVAGPTFGTGSFNRFGGFGMVIPSTISRYSQAYVFLADAPRKGFGVGIRMLTPEDQTKLGSNKGVYIGSVRRGSPAFMADILPNDLLLSVGKISIYDQSSMKAAISAAMGSTVDVELVRDGAHIHKPVTLSADGSW